MNNSDNNGGVNGGGGAGAATDEEAAAPTSMTVRRERCGNCTWFASNDPKHMSYGAENPDAVDLNSINPHNKGVCMIDPPNAHATSQEELRAPATALDYCERWRAASDRDFVMMVQGARPAAEEQG